jgi:hypothetical protein
MMPFSVWPFSVRILLLDQVKKCEEIDSRWDLAVATMVIQVD